MKKATFNDYLSFEYHDEFEQMSDEENKKYFTGDLLRLSFINREKHIVISLSKSKNSFINRLLSVAAVISGSLSNMENYLKDYQLIKEYESTIIDRPAVTECFSYTANDEDIKQYSELSVIKIKNAFYVFYCISRLDDIEEAKNIFGEFKRSLKYVS